MHRKLKSIEDVVRWRLCLGCGVCAYLHPVHYEMQDLIEEGRRPVRRVHAGEPGSRGLDSCPACFNDRRAKLVQPGIIEELKSSFGPILAVFEGYAVDQEIRYQGSSGGALTALSLFCIEKLGMHGVLHTGPDPQCAYRNKTRLSRSRAELLAATGSRYSPASVCDGLKLVEDAPAPCAIVGQPTEITALQMAAALRPALERKVGLTMSFFCAGSPSTRGTLELLASKGVDPDRVEELRYRGRGWPGNFIARLKSEKQPTVSMSYEESWGFVQAFRPFSVHLCPDGTGEDADISCGDPWYSPPQPGEVGRSMLLARTPRGLEVLRQAVAAGYLHVEPSEPGRLFGSQGNLVQKSGAIWGRAMALRLAGLPAPRLLGFGLFRKWLGLSLLDKLRSTLGTWRRIIKRRYWRPMEVVDQGQKPSKPAS